MKKITIISLIVALFLFASNQNAEAQCKQTMVYDCATKTKAIYLRDFNAKLKRIEVPEDEAGIKWSVVLNKGTRYRFNLCTPEGFEGAVVLTLYDSTNPEATSEWTTKGKTDDTFDFIATRSGAYYVSIKFAKGQGDKKTCAVGILSFVGKS